MTHEQYLEIITTWQADQFESESDKLNYWIVHKPVIEGKLPQFSLPISLSDKLDATAQCVTHIPGTNRVRINK